MTQITSFAERAKVSLREQLLDAAAELLPAGGYTGLRMAEVADRVGVSRQTVYNEFGGKSALVQAVALRTAAEFIAEIDARLDAEPDPSRGIHAATVYTIERAGSDRLVAAVLGTGAAADLMPLLTTRGAPILAAAVESSKAYFADRLPGADEADCTFLAETASRLTLSHLVLPTGTPEDAAHAVCAVLDPLLRRHKDSRPTVDPQRT